MSFISNIAGNLGSQTQAILTTKQTAKFMSGARCILRVNGDLIGFAFGVSWRIQTMADEIYGIDDYLPKDIAPNKILVTGTLSAFRVPGSGGPTALNMQSTVLMFARQSYITIEVRDTATDWLLLYVPQAMVVDRSEDIRAENLASMSMNWKAIGWKDERDPMPASDNENPESAGSVIDSAKNALNSAIDVAKKALPFK